MATQWDPLSKEDEARLEKSLAEDRAKRQWDPGEEERALEREKSRQVLKESWEKYHRRQTLADRAEDGRYERILKRIVRVLVAAALVIGVPLAVIYSIVVLVVTLIVVGLVFLLLAVF